MNISEKSSTEPMQFDQYMSPYLMWTLMSNGIDVARSGYALPLQGGYTRFNLTVTGNHPRHRSSATQYGLNFQDAQWVKKDAGLLVAQVGLTVDAMPYGYSTPMLIDCGYLGDAPNGLLHWMKDNPICEAGDWDKVIGFEHFSLVAWRNS
jgi:hypothetical protein